MINAEDMQDVAAGRSATYAVLAALYAQPPSHRLAAMIRAGGLVQQPGSAVAEAAEALTRCFRDTAPGGSDNDICAEYTRLFVLPSGVVPHESFYTDENRRVGGHVTVAVKRYYEAAAAQLTDACLELPDHMGVELEFMKFLCDLEAQFWQEGNHEGLGRCLEFQQGFLEGHLLRWHEALCRKIAAEATLDLYRAVARLTVDFLGAEGAFVPELAREVRSEGRNVCAYA